MPLYHKLLSEELDILIMLESVNQVHTIDSIMRKGIWKEYERAVYLFNPYAEYIMRNARLDELQAGIKIGRRNINKLRYADDTTPTEENKEEQKSLLMRVKEESERASLKLNTKKTKIMASSPFQFSSVTQSCPTLCNPMNRSTPGLPVHH